MREKPLNVYLKNIYLLCLIVLCLVVGDVQVVCAGSPDQDLTQFSIEELMNIKVTSVNKKSQRLSDSAAAVFVITRDEIRRSGITNIPDALRMVPGVNVARIDSNKWAVNCRGFNSRFSPSLQVLVDGRSVYTPSFSGVYWEVTDVLLEDVDRIEVIRGPGATVWGSNAVNGVINIITRSSRDTQGGFVQASLGTVEKNMAAVRYGDTIGKDISWRLYAQHRDRDEFERVSGEDAGDDWMMNQAGFRMDAGLTPSDSVTLQGDVYNGHIHQDLYLISESSPYMDDFPTKTNVSGGNILGRWTRTLSGNSEMSLQMYYDAMKRYEDILNEDRKNFDMDFQHRFGLLDVNDIIWGLRLRISKDNFNGSKIAVIDPVSTRDNLYSAFIQDEISMLDNQVKLTIGSKFEHNDYTGFECQPTSRLMWIPGEHHRVWTAVSRAVRIPSRVETNASIWISGQDTAYGIPLYSRFLNNEDQEEETLWAYEAGYRFIHGAQFSLDLALFYNDYEKLRIYAPVDSPYYDAQNNILIQEIELSNMSNAHSWGAELSMDLATGKKTKWTLAYSFTRHSYDNDEDFELDFGFTRHQASLRYRYDLLQNLTLDTWLRYVGKTKATYGLNSDAIYDIDDYTTLDLRLGWKIRPDLEFFLVGQNLLEDSHLEFVQEAFSYPVEVSRSVYAGVTFKL